EYITAPFVSKFRGHTESCYFPGLFPKKQSSNFTHPQHQYLICEFFMKNIVDIGDSAASSKAYIFLIIFPEFFVNTGIFFMDRKWLTDAFKKPFRYIDIRM